MPLPDHLNKAFGTTPVPGTRRLHSAVGKQLFEYVLEKPTTTQAVFQGTILIVDHDHLSRDILARNVLARGQTAIEMTQAGWTYATGL